MLIQHKVVMNAYSTHKALLKMLAYVCTGTRAHKQKISFVAAILVIAETVVKL